MDPSNRRTNSVTPLLVGIVLLIGLAGVFVAFVPAFKCPEVWLHGSVYYMNNPNARCDRCKDRNRVTLLNRWMMGPCWKPVDAKEPFPE